LLLKKGKREERERGGAGRGKRRGQKVGLDSGGLKKGDDSPFELFTASLRNRWEHEGKRQFVSRVHYMVTKWERSSKTKGISRHGRDGRELH